MKYHFCHFVPSGILRACHQLQAGRQLCRLKKQSVWRYFPNSVNSMMTAWNFAVTIRDKHLPHPKTILDVGANLSQMARLLCLACDDAPEIFSFEPNVALVPLGHKFHVALSDIDGRCELYVPCGDSLWGTIEKDHINNSEDTPHFTVPQFRFDSLVKNGEIRWPCLKRPILLKIDTEGSEMKVLSGFGDLLCEIDYVLVESDNKEGYNSIMDLNANLKSFGFQNSKVLYACCDEPSAPVYLDMLFFR